MISLNAAAQRMTIQQRSILRPIPLHRDLGLCITHAEILCATNNIDAIA
jgi:hypothetical protein